MEDVRTLKEKLERAVERDRSREALEVLDQLEVAEPDKARWPHRRGDLMRKLGRRADAVQAYERAVSLYAAEGFLARAVALARLVVDLDPSRTDVLDRVDPRAARRLLRPDAPSSPSAPRAPAPTRAPLPTPPSSSAPRAAASAPPASPASAVAAMGARATAPPKAPALDPLDQRPALSADDALRARPRIQAPALVIEEEISLLDLAQPTTDLEIEVDLSDVAVEPRAPLPAGEDGPSADALASLPAFPLFADAPRAALGALVRGADVIELPHGAIVVRQGQPAEELYAIVEGAVRVVIPGLETSAQPIFGEGELFGESCLLEHEPRKADVVVEGRLFALRISRAVLRQVVEEHPAAGEVLFALMTRRLVGNLLQSSSLFTAFDPASRRELGRLFEVRRAARGACIVEEGKKSDGLYIPLTGRLELRSRKNEHADVAGPGTVIGQETLLTQAPSEYTATAAKEMALLCLPAASFGRVASQYPPVLAHLAELAADPNEGSFGFDSLLG
jgi:CRP-like cAMP-binding protein